jgi:hypothetical protein
LEYQIALGSIATVLVLVGYVTYLKGAVFGKTKSHAFSWLIWGVLNGLIFFASTSKGAGAGAWAVGASGALNFIIFGIALVKGEKEVTSIDKACLVAAFFGMAAWAITTNPLWSVIIITAVDVVGFVPTFRKAYKRPTEESVTIFILSSIAYFLSLFALQAVNLVTFIYPATLVMTDTLFVSMVLYRRSRSPLLRP